MIPCTSGAGTPEFAESATTPSSTAYVEAVATLFPNALLQWEDFAPGNGRRILEKYRDRIGNFSHFQDGARRRRTRLPNRTARPRSGPRSALCWPAALRSARR